MRPTQVKIYEVGPRDGLQNEKQILPVAVKIGLIERLADAGLLYIEAGAFVSPQRVPQMADTAAVLAGLKRKAGVTYSVLVPNDKGMAAALAVGVVEIAVFAAASETFSQKNINCSIEESFARFLPVIETAKKNNIRVRGYVSCVADCPYEGAIAPEAVAGVAARLRDMGCYEISLGDTIGTGTPEKITAMLNAVMLRVPVAALALHCHDTYGRALVNIETALERGVAVIDSSVAGIGGCPYAKGATGNVATEDVLAFMDKAGIQTGVDREKILEAASFIADHLGRGAAPLAKLK